MVSRILGFFLGILFLTLSVLPFIIAFLDLDFLAFINDFYNFHTIGPIPTISIIFIGIGLFCFQSAIRDTWPFYG